MHELAQVRSGESLFCRSLGALQLEVDGVPVDIGGRLPRRMLTGLLMTTGAVVSDAMLVELVWGPANTVGGNALRVVVSRLRTALGPRLRHRLRRTGTGYQFVVSPDQTDHHSFVDLVGDGRRLLADGELDAAARGFESALALWRGQPWADLEDASVVIGPRARLVELHAVAVEELLAATLARGDVAGAVAALHDAVVAAPYRERRWELLALGLYRNGRQTDALAQLRLVRKLLLEEVGVEPGPALRALEQRILDHDPSLLGAGDPRDLLGPRLASVR